MKPSPCGRYVGKHFVIFEEVYSFFFEILGIYRWLEEHEIRDPQESRETRCHRGRHTRLPHKR